MRRSMDNRSIRTNQTRAISRLLSTSLLSMALIFGVGTAWAGGNGHGHKHDPQSHLERLTKKLDLTKEQQDKILPILQEKHQKMDALHSQMKDVRKHAMSQVEAQLTPEQQEKFKKAREKRKEKMKKYKEKHGKGKTQCKEKHGKKDDHD